MAEGRTDPQRRYWVYRNELEDELPPVGDEDRDLYVEVVPAVDRLTAEEAQMVLGWLDPRAAVPKNGCDCPECSAEAKLGRIAGREG